MEHKTAFSLARSQPKQTYAKHVEGVSENVQKAVDSVIRYIPKTEVAQFFKYTATRAAQWHDLGKLSSENQEHLKKEKQGSLPLDHQDAGVAYSNQNAADDFAVSILIKAHHGGLQDYSRERSRLYRGEKNSFAYRSYDQNTLDDTQENLREYVEKHQGEMQAPEPEKVIQIPWRDVNALLYRLMLSCLVDADHRDAAGRDQQFPPRPACRWKERLSQLKEHMSHVFSEKSPSRKECLYQEVYYACCEAEIKPMAYCDAPIDISKIGTLMAYGLRAADLSKLKHVFLVVRHDDVAEIVNILRAEIVLTGEDGSKIVAAYRAKDTVARDQGLGTLWRAPVIVLSEREFWKSIGARAPKDVRKLREVAGSAILFYDCFADQQRWKWPQEYEWLKSLSVAYGCRILLQSDIMFRFWKCPSGDLEKPCSILSRSFQQRISDYERQCVSFCFDQENPICIHDLEELAARLIQEPGPRLVVFHTKELAEQLEVVLKSSKEIVYLASSRNDLRDKMEQLKQENANIRHHVTLVTAGVIPEKHGFSFASGFVQIQSMSMLLRTALLMENGQKPANLYLFEPCMETSGVLEDDYRSSIPLREMIKQGGFQNYCLSDLLTKAIWHEFLLQSYDNKAEKLKKAEKTMQFKKVADLISN